MRLRLPRLLRRFVPAGDDDANAEALLDRWCRGGRSSLERVLIPGRPIPRLREERARSAETYPGTDHARKANARERSLTDIEPAAVGPSRRLGTARPPTQLVEVTRVPAGSTHEMSAGMTTSAPGVCRPVLG